jgi:hypothetical protein
MSTTPARRGSRVSTRAPLAALASLALLAAVTAILTADEGTERPPAVVRFADGNTVPLRQWSLSYEYFSWPERGSQADGTAARRTAPDLWVGRKAIPLGGATLQIEYVATERERDVDGEARKVKVPQARALKLVREGKTTQLKLEAPHRELLAPDRDKKQMVAARSLDLRGESLTGTKMEICVVSYTVLVECGESAEHQVVQIEFPQ